MGIDGFPQPDRYRKLGGRKIGGSGKKGGCFGILLALFVGPWLLDLLLAGSRATG